MLYVSIYCIHILQCLEMGYSNNHLFNERSFKDQKSLLSERYLVSAHSMVLVHPYKQTNKQTSKQTGTCDLSH